MNRHLIVRPSVIIVAAAILLTAGGYKYATREYNPPDRGRVIFLGDSITRGLNTETVTKRATNLAVSGSYSSELISALPKYPIASADLVVLTIGTNDMRYRREGLEDRLRLLSDMIDRPLLWNAIPPNADIDVSAPNAVIQRICMERPNCTYLETPFQADDLQEDGIHLSDSGYKRWTKALRSAIADTDYRGTVNVFMASK